MTFGLRWVANSKLACYIGSLCSGMLLLEKPPPLQCIINWSWLRHYREWRNIFPCFCRRTGSQLPGSIYLLKWNHQSPCSLQQFKAFLALIGSASSQHQDMGKHSLEGRSSGIQVCLPPMISFLCLWLPGMNPLKAGAACQAGIGHREAKSFLSPNLWVEPSSYSGTTVTVTRPASY
jgi:hypothetical protein